jgi:hypothetical protein
MDRGSFDPASLYERFARMGLSYGPSHRSVTAIYLGPKGLLAELHLPVSVEATQRDYVLHPSLMDGALQASLGVFVDLDHPPDDSPSPFALKSLRIVSPCTNSMLAWVRRTDQCGSDDRAVQVDIDLCDKQGNVCVEMRGLVSRFLDVSQCGTTSADDPVDLSDGGLFDYDFYDNLIADVLSGATSVDDAVAIG